MSSIAAIGEIKVLKNKSVEEENHLEGIGIYRNNYEIIKAEEKSRCI